MSPRAAAASLLAAGFAAPALAVPAFASPALAVPHGVQEGNRATMALNALESKGYPAFTHFRADGRDFSANVMRGGKTIHVIVAPATGVVRVQS
jgi:hypothetical protein